MCGIALACCTLGVARSAALDDARPERPASVSISSGFPWSGRLLRAVRLRMSAALRPVTEYARSGNFYGTSELVALLERAAHVVAARFPGSQLSVGELSGPRGGKIDGHRSHRNGRDVDVAFFMHDAEGRASAMHAFVTFRADGSAQRTQEKLYFDDAKNWAMVAAMLRSPEARVQYMFVAKRIRARLLAEGHRQGESEELLRIASTVMMQPKRGHKHANHFHVRIYCADDDRPHCRDAAPYWPWYEATKSATSLANLPARDESSSSDPDAPHAAWAPATDPAPQAI
jgi:penicillin-insensitive murein endopeptidase